MRSIRGQRHPSDDERTVEAPPEEPTISAQVDVRAAFAAQDITLPGVVEERTLPGPHEDRTLPGPQEDRTLPGPEHDDTLPGPQQQDRTLLVAANTGPMRARAHTLPLVHQPEVTPVSIRHAPRAAAVTTPLAVPSTPREMLVQRLPQSAAAAEDTPPYDVPGVGAQRKRMQRIVMGVLAFCGLLCVGALVRQFWPDAKDDETKRAETKTSAAAPPSAAPELPSAAATATASEVATAAPEVPSATAAAPAPPPTSEPAPIATPVAAPTPAPPPTPTPVVATNTPRRPEAHAPVTHAKPSGASGPSGAKPPARGTIVRDSPF